MSTGFLYEILKCLLKGEARLGTVFTCQPNLPLPVFFAYIGGYSTNIGVHKHIPAAAEGLQYPFIFAYIGGYSTNIGFLKDM